MSGAKYAIVPSTSHAVLVAKNSSSSAGRREAYPERVWVATAYASASTSSVSGRTPSWFIAATAASDRMNS